MDGHASTRFPPPSGPALAGGEKPVMIIARTIKGKGVPAVENKNGWHGKVLEKEDVDEALKLLEPLDKSVRGEIARAAGPGAAEARGAARSRALPTRWASRSPRGRRTAMPSSASTPRFPTWSSSTGR